MSNISSTSTEAQRLGEQEDAIVEKSKDFLISSLKWSLALLGAQDFLISMQATFIAISGALIMLFSISSRLAQSNRGLTFINLTFLVLGCFVVGITLHSIVLNCYIKWVIYGMLVASVTTNPEYRQIFQEMKRTMESMCGAICSRLKELCIQSRVLLDKRFKINVENREESSVNNTHAIQTAGDGGGRVGEEIV